MPLPLTGSCQCRAIRYEIRAEPLTLYACHCTECQKQSGSAFALSMVVLRESVAVTAGEPKIWQRRHESGRIMDAVLCGTCGARLWHNPQANPRVSIVKPGTLDDTRRLHPIGHIWTKSAQPWVTIPETTVNYEGQHPDPVRLTEAWKQARAGTGD